MNAAILTLGLYPSSGGPAKSVPAFQRSLGARVISWEDPLYRSRERSIWTEALVVEGRRFPGLRQLLVPSRTHLAAAEQIVAESGIVSVHGFWRWHNAWACEVTRRHQVPYWFVTHGSLDPYVLQTRRIAKTAFMSAVGRRFLDRASAVVCSSGSEYEKVRSIVGDKPHIVVYWPLDREDFRSRDALVRSLVRRRLGIPDEARCLLFLGRLHRMKRPLETIAAVAAAGYPDLHLLIAGGCDGVTTEECLAEARRVGLEGRVHMLGPVVPVERRAAIDASDAYISLSHRENFNYAAAESLASGLPVILSPGNDLAGDLESVGCGWLLKSTADAPDAIHSMASMRLESVVECGARGREWAQGQLRFETFQSKVVEFAERLRR